jgi:uncharacterized protein YijF (DUF1287 family)
MVALWGTQRIHQSPGEKLAAAAKAQIGVTTRYDPAYIKLPYPNGDLPQATGVCADVIVRAARSALQLDLQRLVHEDMLRDFPAYPARRLWGSTHPDSNIDHRRVPNLEAYWYRSGARLWTPSNATAGDAFPVKIETGDLLTWKLDARLPHVGIVANCDRNIIRIVHNVGAGVEEVPLTAFRPHRANGHFRWPTA